MAKLNALNIKQADHKLAMLTAYDFQFARLLDESDVDIVLVGDSLGNVALGYKNTIPVTMEEMEVHVRAVARGVKRALTAIRWVKAGADAVKIEGAAHLSAVRKIIEAGIPVMGHLGFTPQSVKQLGYKVQGKERRSAAKILADARALEKAGCFAVVLEMVPEGLAAKTARSLKVPVIGIGAGKKVDGQVLVTSDLIGLYENPPSFVKKRADVAGAVRRAVGEFIKEVGK